MVRGFRKSARGSALIEYGTLLALVAVVTISVIGRMGTVVESSIDRAGTSMDLVASAID